MTIYIINKNCRGLFRMDSRKLISSFLSDSVEFLGMIRSSPQTPGGAAKETDQVDDVD